MLAAAASITSRVSTANFGSSMQVVSKIQARRFNPPRDLSNRMYRSSSSRLLSSQAPAGTVMVSIQDAQETTAKALQAIGWDAEDAQLQAEVMTAAELCGNNQGLVKMYQPHLMAPAKGARKPTVERDTETSAVVNANQSPGMLAAVTAADLVAAKLQKGKQTIAIVSTYNTSTSSGQLAFYAERIAKKGWIGIAMANSPEFVFFRP